MPRALVSVSDKTGVVELATALAALGWELVSTGGTSKALRDAGLSPIDVATITDFPEMLDGRVKTLHPAVHGGLLARRDLPAHMSALEEQGITPIDLIAVNLYPFSRTAARPGIEPDDVIEQIDIGGPSMLRSAAKNFASVTVLVDPADYTTALRAITDNTDMADLRRKLAEKVFAHTAGYDAAIATWFAKQSHAAGGDKFPESVVLPLRLVSTLRYGENPWQAAAFYSEMSAKGLSALRQRGGKELSFNNFLDLEGALIATDAFEGEVACALVKHSTPCGIAVAATPLEAYRKALACDPVSAFGSVISFNTPVDSATAEAVSTLFVECVVAPAFSDEAAEILGRKKNLRLLEGTARWGAGDLDFKRVRGGFVAQDSAMAGIQSAGSSDLWNVVTRRSATAEERTDLEFAWKAVASVKSNAIVLARGGATVGIGAGQMSRVDASFMAAYKARDAGHDTAGTVLGSDAFFPFRDGVDQAAAAGDTAIIQPGGSVRDEEVIAAADEHGIAMIFTGKRQFRH
jgi:phosphoribosylaminoimidazolecarboxamide formyltransferase/IMP cyclohydrolase